MKISLLKFLCNKYLAYYNAKNSLRKGIFERTKPKSYNKIFCIGFGKTGTTSLGKVLKDMGFSLGNQAVGEMLLRDYAEKRYDNIINYFHTANAFQDCPSSLPGIYRIQDKEFTNSKFIISVRNSDQQWYESLSRFHTRVFSSSDDLPSIEDLKNANYRYKSWALYSHQTIYNVPKVPLFDPTHYKRIYCKHLEDVEDYFAGRDNLLKINLEEKDSLKKLCEFLDFKAPTNYNIPHLQNSK